MPRTKLARRFEPRFGVSQLMIDTEGKYVRRELEDHLILSTNELRDKLAMAHQRIAASEVELQRRIAALPDRERLAIRCMLARDCWHIAVLYASVLASPTVTEILPAEATGPIATRPEELDKNEEPMAVIPFKETLFG
jgi:hypothetical protein